MHQNIISSFKASKKERKGRFLKISERMLCVGVCLFTKKIDYLGCKCFVFTLFVLEQDTSTQKKIS